MIQLSRDFATQRRVFGKFILDHALHMQTLAKMEVSVNSSFITVCLKLAFCDLHYRCVLNERSVRPLFVDILGLGFDQLCDKG